MSKLLHEVISEVIQKAGRPLSTKQIAEIIEQEDLWRRPTDGYNPGANQISARVANYPQLFSRRRGEVSLVQTSENEVRIARLTYNSNGWQFPSGPKGKSKSKEAYESEYGYGHEEWLLDFTKIIDGYHYAFLEPINKNRKKYEGAIFDIILYTVNSETNERSWVGRINNCEVITSGMADMAKARYKREGWFDEMKQEISELGFEASRLDYWSSSDLFNVRFRPGEYESYPAGSYIANDDPSVSSYHYVLLHVKDEPQIEQEGEGEFVLGRCNPKSRFAGDTIKRKQEEKYIEYPLLHHDINRALEKTLRKDFDQVYAEHQTGEKTSIDLVAVKGRKMNFYEIKTYNDVRTCIRMALGQLLEYSYYPKRKLADELYIVTPHVITDRKLITYVECLQEIVGLPIRYMAYDLKAKSISQLL